MPRANEVYPIRPERAEALSPGHRPGYYGYIKVALKGQKLSISKLLPFQGDLVYFIFSIFFSSFSNLLRYISPAMVKPNGKAIQMPSNPMPQGKPRV
jgi:hypothetical protein